MLLQVHKTEQDSEQINKYTWNDRAPTNTALEDIRDRETCLHYSENCFEGKLRSIHLWSLSHEVQLHLTTKSWHGCRLLAFAEHHSCILCSWAVGAVCFSVIPDQATVVNRYLKKPSGKAGFNCQLGKKSFHSYLLQVQLPSAVENCFGISYQCLPTPTDHLSSLHLQRICAWPFCHLSELMWKSQDRSLWRSEVNVYLFLLYFLEGTYNKMPLAAKDHNFICICLQPAWKFLLFPGLLASQWNKKEYGIKKVSIASHHPQVTVVLFRQLCLRQNWSQYKWNQNRVSAIWLFKNDGYSGKQKLGKHICFCK